MITKIDHLLLVPVYAAAGTALLAFLTDLLAPRWRAGILTITALGAAATAASVPWVNNRLAGDPSRARATFCIAPPAPVQDAANTATIRAFVPGCSYSYTHASELLVLLFALVTLAVLAMSWSALRDGGLPVGEYCFLLACAMTGGVVLASAADLITLIIALETLTLPLYVLVGLRRRSVQSAEGAVTFFVISVVATTVTLLGAALLYALTGTVYLNQLATTLAARPELRHVPLAFAAVVLILVGLAFKVAAVPFHAWAPAAYDGAPVPVAAYLSTASKLGGVVAILYVATQALAPWLNVVGPVLAVLAALTMTVGNLVALRQQRMVRLLAWSSIAQAGYLLAPLGALALAKTREPTGSAFSLVVAATIAYTVFYLLMEVGAFAGVIALRGAADGGDLDDYRGAATRAPWITGAFLLALAGLAGLPPGLAGLFAKVTVVRALLGGGAGWLAVIVALNAVIGLAYYVRAAASLFGRGGLNVATRTPWPVGAVVIIAAVVALVVGFAPQIILHAADMAAGR
jgi:NADH-quinone oxidoreductase subunit N